jgi:hypothetical protein
MANVAPIRVPSRESVNSEDSSSHEFPRRRSLNQEPQGHILKYANLLPKERQQQQWDSYLGHDSRPRFCYIIDGQVTEILASDVAEVERIVEENWPGGGGMIAQSEHNNPRSLLGVVYSKIPEAVKVAFGYLSAAYGAIATRYPGRHLVFTPTYVFLCSSRDEGKAFEEFSAFKNAEEGGILVRAGGLTRVHLFSAPEPSQSSIPSNPNTPITLNAPNTPSNPWTFPGPASSWMPPQGQQQSSTARKVRRMLENESGTALLCSMKISPSLDPQDFREVHARNVLYDTGCETTTVYGPEENIVYASDILTAAEMFGIDGNITPVIRVKRHVSLMPIRWFEPDITYYIDINLPVLTVGLLVSVFRAQSPEDQDSLAHNLIAKARPTFGPEEAYNLMDTWHNEGFPEPTGRLLTLLNLVGIKGSFNFPYQALLGYNMWRLWAREGIEYREEQGRFSIWGR